MPDTLQSSFTMQHTPYNSANWAPQGGSRYGLGNDLATSMNKQLIDGYVNKGLSSLLSEGKVGVYSTTKVDSSDFGRYLQLLPDFATRFGLIRQAVDMAQGNNLFDVGALSNVGPRLEYLPVDNKDGLRMHGFLMYDNDNRNNQYRVKIDQESIDKTEELNGTDEGFVSKESTLIYLSKNSAYINDLKTGCASCVPNSCGNGLRQLFLIKNSNPAFGGSYPQNGFTSSETLLVVDVKDPGDGGMIMEVIRGANRKTVTNGGNIFTEGGIDIEAGDFLLVGTITPTTECIATNLKCEFIQPKIYSYCSTIKTFQDCVACMGKTQFLTQQSHEIMTRKEQLAYSILNNLKTFYQRAYNEFVYGDEIYAQHQPAPAHPSPDVNFGKSNNGELIPAGFRGIFKQFDAYARELELTFTSCEQTCWEYSLTTMIEALDAGLEGSNNAASYTDGGWLMVGDIEGMEGIYRSRFTNTLAFNPDQIQERNDRIGFTYDDAPVSIFAENSSNAANARKLNNEFNRMGNDYGIRLGKLQIGKYKFRALHDRGLAAIEPGVIRLIFVPDITFFTDNQDATMDGIFGGSANNPFLRASAVEGRLSPNIVSYNYAPAHLNGKMQMLSANDCPMNWTAIMRAGVFLKPVNLPRSIKITLNSLKSNPTYDAQNPATGDPFIKDTIYALNCGCMTEKKRVIDSLDTFANGPLVTDFI